MVWNYRVIKMSDQDEEEWIGICEVFYNDKDEPILYSSPVCVSGESLDDLDITLYNMVESVGKPILTKEDFK